MQQKYILVTPMHNEIETIEDLIKSVLAQGVLPYKWVIVDDASTDNSDEIVKKYCEQHNFIIYRRIEKGETQSNYYRRTIVFLKGFKQIEDMEFDFIGSLDADIILEPTYYQSILEEFDKNPEFGIVSGVYMDKIGDKLCKVLIDKNHTPGAIQTFRRACYEEIGGYIPLKYGGDDTCAEITARMKGWQTISFPEYIVQHSRPVGTGGNKTIYQARFHQGLTEYSVATHPFFMLAKSLRRAVLEKPYVFGSIARLAGFIYGYLIKEDRQISQEAMSFVRKEQLKRLIDYIKPS